MVCVGCCVIFGNGGGCDVLLLLLFVFVVIVLIIDNGGGGWFVLVMRCFFKGGCALWVLLFKFRLFDMIDQCRDLKENCKVETY